MKFLCLNLFAMLIVSSVAKAEPVKLKLDSGTVIGTSDGEVKVFKGIPYAKPPVGDLRWQPPQRINWIGERDATQYALPCPQPTPSSGVNGGGVSGATSEDCLYLNVWMPKNAKNAPVMLFLYGGAGFLGAGSVPTYDGTSFAKKGIVLVTINYRLGMLGVFAHPALSKIAKPDEPLANYQLMDAIAALEWVQRNGKALGANTRNVTLFGQSAGAVMVAALLSTPPSKDLFQKVIIQSAVPQLGGSRTLAQAEANGVKFATTLGLTGEDATPAELRALPVEKVISGEALSSGFRNGSYLVIDGKVRTTTTGAGFTNGATVDVPLITGSTKAEFFGPEAGKMVDLASRTGKAAAWQYFFTYVPEWRAAQQPKGPPHAAELPYVFDTLRSSLTGGGSKTTESDEAVAKSISSCWVAFAKARQTAKSLTCEDGFVWHSRTPENDAIAVFGEKPSMAKATPLISENAIAFPIRADIGEPTD